MRILFVQDSLGTGGAERSNVDLWLYLISRGVRLFVIVFKTRNEGVQKEVEHSGIDFKILPSSSIWKQCKGIADAISDFKPDLVHSVLLDANLRTRLAKLWNQNFVHIESLVSTPYDDSRRKDPAINSVKLELYRRLDGITARMFTEYFHAITKVVADHHVHHLGLNPATIRVIPRGRNPNEYRQIRSSIRGEYANSLGFLAKTFLIVSTGREEYAKGHIHFLKVLKQLRKNGFEGFTYLILGRRGRASREIDLAIDQYNLEDVVIRTGHRHDVERILACCDLFVFPSVYEGLGVSLLEAQAAGLPIICNDIAVFYEVTRPGENAVLIDTDQVTEWSDAIRALAGDADRRSRMGRASLDNFQARFMLEDVHRKMYNYYQSAIDEAKAKQSSHAPL